MFLPSAPRRVLAYAKPVDMRKSFNGLVALVQGVLAEDPLLCGAPGYVARAGRSRRIAGWRWLSLAT